MSKGTKDMSKIVIETRHLCKTYGTSEMPVEALKNIDLCIKKGEFISIMGPSGSGKSTLLYLLGCLDVPSSGDIWIDGKNLNGLSDYEQSKLRRQKMGFVFQFYNLLPNYSVEENILLPIVLDGKRMVDYRDKVTRILEIVGLTEKRKFTPRELSGGQQQRVSIARALINDPEIILADEPIGNLDSKTGTEIMELLKRLNEEQGHTVIQVTHSDYASTYGSGVIKLVDGSITT